MSYTVENIVKAGQNKLWLKRNRDRKHREKKQMEELKAWRNGSFAQVGWMDGWLGRWMKHSDGKSLCLSFFSLNLLMTWQWICGVSLLLVNPHTQVLSARSNPALILYLPRSSLCFHNVFKREMVLLGNRWHMVWTYGGHHSWLRTWIRFFFFF